MKRWADCQTRRECHGITDGFVHQRTASTRAATAAFGDGVFIAINTKALLEQGFHANTGGEGGIRTRGRLAPTPDFESGTFDHSATSPTGRNVSTRCARQKRWRQDSSGQSHESHATPNSSALKVSATACARNSTRSGPTFADSAGQTQRASETKRCLPAACRLRASSRAGRRPPCRPASSPLAHSCRRPAGTGECSARCPARSNVPRR